MPLFEVGNDELVPFRRVQAGPDLYEREIEDLLWQNLDAFVGLPLFPVARQAQLGGGLIADVVALDGQGRVFIIEVKRDIDRRQLAQCLEYAGWARNTNLDELAGLFHAGAGAFFSAWTEFTETASPLLIRRPRQSRSGGSICIRERRRGCTDDRGVRRHPVVTFVQLWPSVGPRPACGRSA